MRRSLLVICIALITGPGLANADQVTLPLTIQDGLENMWSLGKRGHSYNRDHAAPWAHADASLLGCPVSWQGSP